MEIKFDNVSLITPDKKVLLKNLNFEIKGEGVYSFIGDSHSNKSLIADLINSLIIPTKGSVKVGRYINDGNKDNNSKTLRRDTGYVLKDPYNMFLNNTVEKELKFYAKYYKYKTDNINMRVIDAFKLVGLDEKYLSKDPLKLSLQDAKKISLACILIYNPKIIILDEYTSGLNYTDKQELLRLLRILKTKYKKIIILITKDTTLAYKITDEVFLMQQNKLVSTGTKELLTNTKLLAKLNLEIPGIISFVEECNKKGHRIDYYNNILDLIKGVYRDVF